MTGKFIITFAFVLLSFAGSVLFFPVGMDNGCTCIWESIFEHRSVIDKEQILNLYNRDENRSNNDDIKTPNLIKHYAFSFGWIWWFSLGALFWSSRVLIKMKSSFSESEKQKVSYHED